MNVVLIGFMGSGKTTVGKALAEKRGMNFLDLDEELEKHEGRSIKEIVETEGMDAFRVKESLQLKQLASRKPQNTVVATGGGVVLSEENRVILKKMGKMVWLDVSPELAHQRTKDDPGRPLLNHPNRRAVIDELIQKRKSGYQQAEIHIRVDEKSTAQTVQEIEEKL